MADSDHEHDDATSVGVVAVTILAIMAVLTGLLWAGTTFL